MVSSMNSRGTGAGSTALSARAAAQRSFLPRTHIKNGLGQSRFRVTSSHTVQAIPRGPVFERSDLLAGAHALHPTSAVADGDHGCDTANYEGRSRQAISLLRHHNSTPARRFRLASTSSRSASTVSAANASHTRPWGSKRLAGPSLLPQPL